MTVVHSPGALGQIVRGRRQDLGASQAAVAQRAGVSRKWVYEFEAGKPSADLGLVLRVLDALGLELAVAPAHLAVSASQPDDDIDLDVFLDELRRRD